jgi:DNA-binding CsgD family transcriptional regulator
VRRTRAESGETSLEAGREALLRGEWDEARTAFEQAVAAGETAEALEGLAAANMWLHDEAGTFGARERAYNLYLKRGDKRSAARMAMWLATDSVEFRGQPAVANGWLQRARRLLEGLPETPEHGWLALWEGQMALMLANDAATGRSQGKAAADAGRRLGQIDLEMLGLALEGLSLVTQGEIQEGMRRLDEAATAAVGGEMMDLNSMGTTLCYLIDACDRVRDFERAVQWCTRAEAFLVERRCGIFFTFCRPHYAVVLMWRGLWDEAEQQLLTANREAVQIRPPMVTEGIVRLAELRWRQGRWQEADELFEQVKHEGLAQLGLAEVALSRGDSRTATDLAARYLRRLPAENRIERAAGLEAAVRALVADGRAEEAVGPLTELKAIAEHAGTELLRASAAFAGGILSAANGDLEGARRSLEDAADSFERQRAPFETGRVRMELARALASLGRSADAGREATLALQEFRRIGAAKETEAAAAFLTSLQIRSQPAGVQANPASLSNREIEVLGLVAAGKSNQEIADELFLSVRTVERHISTIYEKLGAHGKAARAAATAYALQHRLAH